MNGSSLFDRLGGSPGITALVDDVVSAHMRNPVISARFRPYLDTPERMTVLKGHLCAFLAAGCGGPQEYAGRSMRDAHLGMNVSEAEYMAALDDILGALRRRGIDERTQTEILGIAYSLKGDIIHV